MRLDGRIERRVPRAVPVYFAGVKELQPGERALTENVSPHGARLVTKRGRRLNEETIIGPLIGEIKLPARVVYCLPRLDGRFYVGLEFRGRSVEIAKWLLG
jgi:hypothetical protein